MPSEPKSIKGAVAAWANMAPQIQELAEECGLTWEQAIAAYSAMMLGSLNATLIAIAEAHNQSIARTAPIAARVHRILEKSERDLADGDEWRGVPPEPEDGFP